MVTDAALRHQIGQVYRRAVEEYLRSPGSAGSLFADDPSTMTLGGLLNHLALVEDDYFSGRLFGREPMPPFDAVDWDAEPDWEWLAQWIRRDGRAPSLRRIRIDVIEEYARHVGHADLIRESVDGQVGGSAARLAQGSDVSASARRRCGCGTSADPG